MMILASLFTPIDVIAAPICFVILLMFFSVVVKKYRDDTMKRLFVKAFYFKMGCTLAYTLLMSFYYKGGDTEMYYHCTLDLHQAVMDNTDNFIKIYKTKLINVKSDLKEYFIFDGSIYPNFEFMHSASNFFVPKLGLPFALIFNKSYICIAMFFSLFSLGGAIRLYKFFIHYFPKYRKEIALAVLFLPSVSFWSSGFLKDSICFGSVGYLVYGMFSLFIRRTKILSSLIWVAVSIIFLFYIKVYILLALSPGIVLWLFGEFNKVVENKTLRKIMAFMTFVIGAGLAFFLINYVTSDESVQAFKLDTIVETSKVSRDIYEGFSEKVEGSYYTIGTDDPALLVLYGIVATLFRPFLWEVNSPIALFSAIEALFFLAFTVIYMYKRGFFTFFRVAFKNPVFLMCIVFTLIFAAAIGSTATNFGSLSRYKIPCLPFYLVMVLVMYREAGLKYPNWFSKLLGYRVHHGPPVRKTAF